VRHLRWLWNSLSDQQRHVALYFVTSAAGGLSVLTSAWLWGMIS
jgi:hypothetical protein